jgi:hypothetical protein
MTRFFIDSREIAQPFDISSLTQVLKHVEAVHLAPNTVIRQIQIDGLPLEMPLSEESSDALFQLERRNKIEMFTGTVAEIARDSIADALRYLDQVEKAIPSLITSFQPSSGQESFEGLKHLYEGLYWLNVLIGKLKTRFQLNLDHAPIRGVSAQEYDKKFILVLKQLIESQQNRDSALIADLLEYEIIPLVPIWKDVLGIIAERINTAQ